MKSTLIALITAGLIAFWFISLEIFPGLFTTSEFRDQNELFESSGIRPSITFILGQDRPDQKYFDLAERHFLSDAKEKTDMIVKSCKSLSEMLNYLDQYKKKESPWGVVQVVVHGNVWSGLSVPMWPEGPRAYPKDLLKAVKQKKFPSFKEGVLDEQTKINIWACGIGKNPYLNRALKRIFETESGVGARVHASPHFVIFREDGSGIPKRLKASYWPYFFKRGYRPSVSEITHEYISNYPIVNINWEEALTNEEVDGHGATFNHSFHVPIVWKVLYDKKEDRPNVGTQDEKMAWLASQEGLQKKIRELGIPRERYHWSVNKILITANDGSVLPAIKAIGMTTVICVMQVEGDNHMANPFCDDQVHY